MDIWVTYCKRKSKCEHCGEMILAGEPITVGKNWRTHGANTKWCFSHRWHPKCWLEQAMIYLSKHKFIPKAGRPRLQLDDETKQRRNAIMRRRASVIQRIKREVAKPREKQKQDRLEHFAEMLMEQKREIEPIGGVPSTW